MVKGKLTAAVDTASELLLVYGAILLFAATLFSYFEGKSFIDSLYWAGITGPSVGYGDVTPQTVAGKILSVLFAHVALFFIVPLYTARLAMRLIVDSDTFTHEEQEQIKELLIEVREEMKNGR